MEKTVYAHSADLGINNIKDRIDCPIQPDRIKFQRSECRTVTNEDKMGTLLRVLELSTSADPNYFTRKLPMPSYPLQDALAYVDNRTGACAYFHYNSGNFWSAQQLSESELKTVRETKEFKKLD